MTYQRINLRTGAAVGQPGPLPADLAELDAEQLVRAGEHVPAWRGYGFVAVSPPDPPRRLIPKSLVQERVHDVGKLELALAALNSDAISFARWFAPDWPNVYFDDPGLLAILEAIGCTAEEIEMITAE